MWRLKMESFNEFLTDTWSIPEARWIVWATILIIAVLTAVYLAGTFRRLAIGDSSAPVSDLTDFERMLREGQLDEDEFTNLKAEVRSREQAPSGND